MPKKQRGRIPPAPRVPSDVPQIDKHIWEYDPAASPPTPETVALGGQHEMEMWAMVAHREAVKVVRSQFPRIGAGLVAVTVPPGDHRSSGVRMDFAYIARRDVGQQIKNDGDRWAYQVLSQYDPSQNYLMVVYKEDCNPRRLMAIYDLT